MEEMMPDVQYMDMHYDRYYLVPWPDYQKFIELDPYGAHTILADIDGNSVCFVDAMWIGLDYNDDNAKE